MELFGPALSLTQISLGYNYKLQLSGSKANYQRIGLNTYLERMVILGQEPSIEYQSTKLKLPLQIGVIGVSPKVSLGIDIALIGLISFALYRTIKAMTICQRENGLDEVRNWKQLQDKKTEFYNRIDCELSAWNVESEKNKGNGLVLLGAFLVDGRYSKLDLISRLKRIENSGCVISDISNSDIQLLVDELRDGIEKSDEVKYCQDLTDVLRPMVINSRFEISVEELLEDGLCFNCCKNDKDWPELVLYYTQGSHYDQQGDSKIDVVKFSDGLYKISNKESEAIHQKNQKVGFLKRIFEPLINFL